MSTLPEWLTDDGYYSRKFSDLSIMEQNFMSGKARATCILDFQTPGLSYEYADWALCALDGIFYVFSTSGCSCPDPSETWRLEAHGTRQEVREWLDTNPGYSDFALFKSALSKIAW